ncbi:protein adenylyltransferase SelO [Vibrio sonorensis]|uniref:protein adenylyltransferase SelO n=1 Tax=Vibrio sonorensis TaxID=1004316 RepID=UPI0008D9A463|nr:YdiU family protein [Vibrio sonorensis]
MWSFSSVSNRFAALPEAFFSKVAPTPLENTRWVAWNSALAKQLSLPESHQSHPQLMSILSGSDVPKNFVPIAMKYAGHQFGVYNPDLGDGRGLLLCELTDVNGAVWDIHLKGAGMTPYSRSGDGRAVLRSTIREYLCSEAMHGLGIPTTRALGMMVSDTPVYREKAEQGALLIRCAESHIRFGHFEHFFYTQQWDELKLLADKVIDWYWPECRMSAHPYESMFQRVVDTTAKMIAKWQAIGFTHGVMNTDNMSIIGQTFDYGPFAFLDDYDPSYICNHSDYEGRYAFDQQPRIALWNLSALAHSLSTLISKDRLENALSAYEGLLGRYFSSEMRNKLGLLSRQEGDTELFSDLFSLLERQNTDYTNFMRQLAMVDQKGYQPVLDLFVDRSMAGKWLERYIRRCELEVDEKGDVVTNCTRCNRMRQHNPKYILRNYLAQQAIEKAQQGDFSMVNSLAKLLRSPFDEHPKHEKLASLPPDWGKGMEISCSS